MRRRFCTLILVATVTGGCYEYLPVTEASTLIGHRVQLALTDAGSVALASQLGPSVESIDGTLLADSLQSYRIGVMTTRIRSGSETEWRGEVVMVPHTLAASISDRRFSSARTVFAGGLATVGVVGATVGLRGKGSASGGSQLPSGVQGK